MERFDAYYVHLRVHANCWKWHVAALRHAERKAETQLVILDRHWPSEAIYGPVFRGYSQYTPHERSLVRALHKFAAVTVVCLPSERDWVTDRFEQLRRERHEHFESVARVYDRYRDWLFGTRLKADVTYLGDEARRGGIQGRPDVLHYDLLVRGNALDQVADELAEKLEARRASQYPRALRVESHNVLGHGGDAEFVFVGEAPNDPRAVLLWPFFGKTQSAAYLTQRLHRLDFDERRALWTNAISPDPHVFHLKEWKPELKVVALGRRAEKYCKMLGVELHGYVKHPQAARRFHHHGKYHDELREALEGVERARYGWNTQPEEEQVGR